MADKKLSITLFRVSSDSKFLDMIFDCPDTYKFTSLEVEVRTPVNGKFKSKWYDLSAALFVTGSETKKHWSVRLPLEKLGITDPAIYIATLKAEEIDTEDTPDEITDSMVCSDVNDAYYYLLDSILDFSDKCQAISDDAVRDYLILYAHQAAMQQHDFDVAEDYFKMIMNKFDKCGNGNRPTDRHRGSSCNCGK